MLQRVHKMKGTELPEDGPHRRAVESMSMCLGSKFCKEHL